MKPAPLLSALALCGMCALPVAATNTSKSVKLRVTTHAGKSYEGKVRWKKGKLQVGSKKIRFGDIASIESPPFEKEKLLERFAARKGKLEPSELKGWLRLGRWARKQGLHDEAYEVFHHVVEVEPENEDARHETGYIKQDGKWVEAAEVLRKRRMAIKVTDHKGLIKLARFAIEHKQRKHALHYLKEVLLADIWNKDGLRLVKPFTDAYRQKHELILPVAGRWKASPDRTRHHQKKSYAVYALDLTKVDERGKHYKGDYNELESHYAFGAPFYAVAAGTVIEVRDGHPDNPIGKMKGKAELHNGVSIDHGNGEVSWYVHAKKGTITVKLGDTVEQGQLLGLVGNSGGTAIPHLHYTLVSFRGISVPWQCRDYSIIAEDGTPLPVKRAWPREGWIIEAKEPTPPEKKPEAKPEDPKPGDPKPGDSKPGGSK